MASKILVYGGCGPLGNACVKHFKQSGWWVMNVDFEFNDEATSNVIMSQCESWVEQERYATSSVDHQLRSDKLKALLCVSDGWAGGNASKELCKQSDFMWKQTVWPATISATLASKFLAPGGLFCLTGSYFALESTPSMLSYGMAKSAIHHLTRSLSVVGSGLPIDSTVVGILPKSFDTDLNRRLALQDQLPTLTPLSFLVTLFDKWAKGVERPSNGSLITILTEDNLTHISRVCDSYKLVTEDPVAEKKKLMNFKSILEGKNMQLKNTSSPETTKA